LDWREGHDSATWDSALADLNGHPLQSSLWGDVRRRADGIEDRRIMLCQHGQPLLMARMELRHLPIMGGCVGWIPRGPAGGTVEISTFAQLMRRNAKRLPHLLVTDRWRERAAGSTQPTAVTKQFPRTLWLDLRAGRDALWKQLSSAFRQGVRKAEQFKLVVEQTRAARDQDQFFALTKQISDQKQFDMVLSRGAIGELISRETGTQISAHLFVVRSGSALAAAALIMRTRRSVHYISGGTDRNYSTQRGGEALHWGVIQWAITEGAVLYDLEGLDRRRNPGTFAFKKKLGGREVVLEGKEYYPLSAIGVGVAAVDRLRERLL